MALVHGESSLPTPELSAKRCPTAHLSRYSTPGTKGFCERASLLRWQQWQVLGESPLPMPLLSAGRGLARKPPARRALASSATQPSFCGIVGLSAVNVQNPGHRRHLRGVSPCMARVHPGCFGAPLTDHVMVSTLLLPRCKYVLRLKHSRFQSRLCRVQP